MLAYIFWHVPFAHIDAKDYQRALLDFRADLESDPPPGLVSCATFRISQVPWLGDRAGYEDWCFMRSSAAIDMLNKAAVRPQRWDVHAAIAGKMDFGRGGLYYHLHGDEQRLTARASPG